MKAFWKQIQDNIESVGSKGLLEIKIREGLKGDWQAKGRDIMENLAHADRPVTVCLDELPIMLSRLLGGKTDPTTDKNAKKRMSSSPGFAPSWGPIKARSALSSVAP